MEKTFKVVISKTQTIKLIVVDGFRKAKPAIIKIQKLSVDNVSLIKEIGLKQVIFISVKSYLNNSLNKALTAKKFLVKLTSPYINYVTVKFIAIPAPVASGRLTIYVISPVKLVFCGLKITKSLLWDKRVMIHRARRCHDITRGTHLIFIPGYRLGFVIIYCLFLVWSNWNFNTFGEFDRRNANLGPDLAGRKSFGAPGRWPRRSDFKSRKAFIKFLGSWW